MTPLQALGHVRAIIESQGPDTANRHYGRNQYTHLLECCDTIGEALGMPNPFEACATVRIEDIEDTDYLARSWLTVDDVESRLRNRLKELKYWWEP